jgi:hypothetical protein
MTEICALLTPEQFQFYWPAIRKELDTVKHLWEIWNTKESIYEGVVNGSTQCWAIGSHETVYLVAFTTMMYYPANKIFKILLLCGNNMEPHLETIDATFEKFAMDNGCKYIEFRGREGWKKKRPAYQHHGTWFTRKLGNLRMQ